MSFTTNTSNLSGKSTTNAFDIVANSLTVNKNTLCKGDLTVLGTTNIGNISLENGFVNNLTVNNFTANNPVPIASGGTGLATIGSPNQVLTVNSAGTSLIYQAQGLINPATITGTGFTGNPTLSLGIEADTGSLGRGFIRTGVAATSGLLLGTVNATVLRLWSNFSTDSNAEIINTNANFTYNSTGTAGVFQVLNAGGGISFTNSGLGTISMGTAGGSITLADSTSLSGAVNISTALGALNISTAGGVMNLSTGAGSTNITTVAGNLSLSTGIGALSLTTGAGNISLTTVGAGIISIVTATAGAINIGTTVGLVNIYGSGITLGAPIIYIGTGSAVPIPSVLTFACGAVTGITGAWTITTLAFQLNAVSISLNSTSTIALSNNTSVNGALTATGSIVSNSSGLSNTSALNPGIFVYNDIANSYGMDEGYNPTTLRYRTRVFCPAYAGADITLSGRSPSATSQSDFTDHLIVNGVTGATTINATLTTTGNISSGGTLTAANNIFTPQNIISGVLIINSGNATLTAASPETILIRGGSGSIITLPDATTLIIGYSYTINNNSSNPTVINRHTSGSVGTILAGNCAVVTVFNVSSANGQWDIHISGAQGTTDWANPGTIGSATPNTGAFTTLTASAMNVINNTVNPGLLASALAPSLGTNNVVYFGLGKATNSFNMMVLGFLSNGASSSASFTIAGSNTSIDQVYNGKITLLAPTTEITGTSTSLGSGILKVNNTSTAIQSHLAQFLQPTLGGIGVATEDTNITFGKSNTTANAAQLQFGYSSGGLVPFDNPFITLGFYGLSGTRIQLRTNPNPANAQKAVQIFGNTEIVGNFTATGTVSVKNSSVFYQTFTNFSIPNATFTDVTNLSPVFENGLNRLTPTATGFRNDTGLILQVSISFSCVRTDSNPVGSNTIRISYGLFSEYLAEAISQEFQPITTSANFPLQPTQKLRCIIYPDALLSPVQYGQVRITINTTPIVF
jgi:hypothetical protein